MSIERAKYLLEYNMKNGINLESRLKDTDLKITYKEQKFLWMKEKIREFEITEEFAKQYIAMDTINDYSNMLKSYIKRESETYDHFLIFSYPRTPNYDAIKDAQLLKQACDIALNVYKAKQDTPDFDKQVYEIVDVLKEYAPKRAVGDYGVIFGYVVDKVKPLQQEDREKVMEFSYRSIAMTSDKGKEMIK